MAMTEIPMTYSAIASAMARGEGKSAEGDVSIMIFTPYTRRCCEVRKAGVLLGTRYSPKTAWALIQSAKK